MRVVALGAIVCAVLGAALEPAVPQGGVKVDSATTGTVSGRAIFDGSPGRRASLPVEGDRYCIDAIGSTVVSEAVLVGDGGGLRNVFVYVKDGLDPNSSFEPPAAIVTIDQRACQLVPHVLGVQVGQPLVILNSDATLHNVHGRATSNQPFNIGQPIAGMRYTRTFTAPEIMLPLTSDIHSWMSAFVGVVPHPFFAVSAADGSFTIREVPSGAYTVEAWHETFGTATERVIVQAGQTSNLSFTFRNRGAG